MPDSDLEAHQYLSGLKSTTVGLRYDLLWSNIHQEISPIYDILTIQIHLGWDQNALKEEFLKKDDEEF